MPELRDLLEREMDRTGIEPLTLEGFFRRRDELHRRRRITAGVLAMAVAIAATGLAVRAFDRSQGPAPGVTPPRAGSIAFVRQRQGVPGIYMIDPATNVTTRLLDLACVKTAPLHRRCPGISIDALAASPDGTRLAYATRESHEPSAFNTTWTMTRGLYVVDLRTDEVATDRVVPGSVSRDRFRGVVSRRLDDRLRDGGRRWPERPPFDPAGRPRRERTTGP